MTQILLIRHAAHDWLGKSLVGRKPNIAINQEGRAQALTLSRVLRELSIDHLITSPTLRAVETAAYLGSAWHVVPRLNAAFDEIDFGEWAGCTFSQLANESAWKIWNEQRATARAPHGESMREVQERAVGAVERLCRVSPSGSVAVVSHGDVLKSIVAFYQHRSLDLLHTIDLEPASVSLLTWQPDYTETVLLNDDGRNVVGALADID